MENLAINPYAAPYSSTNNVFQDSNSQNESESKEQFNGWYLLPIEITTYILSFLPIKDLIHAGATCHTWKLCSNDRSIWAIFCKQLIPTQPQAGKLEAIEEIKSLIACTQENDSERALGAYVTLSKLGLSSLEKAFNYAKTIKITDQENNNTSYALSFYDKCFSLAYAFLANNELSKAEEIMNNMVPSALRGVIAFAIVKIYLKSGNLEKALGAMRYIKKDQLELSPSLSLLIWKAKQTNTIDIALRALTEFSSCEICVSCAKDFNKFLMETGEFEKSKGLLTSFPQINEEEPKFNDVRYYAYNGQIEKASQKAFLLSKTFHISLALDEIMHTINEATYLNAGINGDLNKKQLNEIKSLKENLWNEVEV